MPSYCFSCINTNDWQKDEREGGREERKKIKNGGRDGEREGTRKEKAKPQTVYFL